MRQRDHSFRSDLFSKSLLAILLSTALAACNLPHNTPLAPTGTFAPTATLAAATPTASPTSPVVTAPTPSATSGSGPTNIVFATGTTAGVESNNIGPGEVQEYTVSAGQNQPMILILTSPNNDAYLGVSEPNGNLLLDPAKKWSSWQWLLPKSEVYSIKVYGGTTSETYVLTVKVAARIVFASGSTSATVNGSTQKGYVVTYALQATANQNMTVTLSAPLNSAALDIFGLAFGQNLLSISSDAVTWTGTLPATQDYIIEVVPNNGTVINFSLAITVH